MISSHMMDFTQLGGFDEAMTPLPLTRKKDLCKEENNKIEFHDSLLLELGLARNNFAKGKPSSGTENYEEQGYSHCRSFSSVAETMNLSEAEHVAAAGICDLGGNCGVRIGLRLGDSMNGSNKNCPRNGGPDIAESSERKRARKGKAIAEDPDWLPHQMGLSGHRSKRFQRTSARNPLREGVGVNASSSVTQRRSSRNRKEMLYNSGWVGVPQWDWHRGFSSLSHSYWSLSKDVETFPHGTSEQDLRSSPLIVNEEHRRNLPSDLRSNVGNFGGHINVCKKGKRTRVSSKLTASTEDMQLPRKQELDKDISVEGASSRESHGNKVSCKVYQKRKSFPKGKSLSSETQKPDCSEIEVKNIDQGSTSDIHHQELRRSARINGKHVLVDYEFVIEGAGYDDLFTSSIPLATEALLLPDKMQYTEEVSKASAVRIVDEKATSCIENNCLSGETEQSSCGRTEAMEVPKDGQSNSSTLYHVNESLEVMKHKKAHDSLASSSCVSMASSLVAEGMGFAEVQEKVKSCHKDKCFSYGEEKNDCCREEVKTRNSSSSKMEFGDGSNSSEVETVKTKQKRKRNKLQYIKSLGVRRSPRISKKLIPAESGLKCGVKKSAKKSANKPFDLNVEPEMECESPMFDTMLVKQITGKKFDCQEAGDKQLLKEGGDKNGTETIVSGKHSDSSACKSKVARRGTSKGKNKIKSRGCRLTIRRPVMDKHEEQLSSKTKVTILSWLIDAGTITENEKVLYNGSNWKGSISKGWLTRSGIRCNCCMKVMSLLEFEVHAGSNLRRPWENTYLGSGKSLMHCLGEAWEKEKNRKKVGFQMVAISDPDPSDDSCGVCADGGSLICCDKCPSTFHQECLKLKSLPEGNWYCPYCRCAFCMMIERGPHTSSGYFGLSSCDQCGRKYHRECAWGHDLLIMGLGSSSFCGENCKKVAAGLSNMLGVSHPIGGGFSWTLLRRLGEEHGIISDKMRYFIMESNMKLTLALSVLDECFDPLVDPRSGLDMISQAVYNCGSNYKRLNFERFHTIILEKDDEIVSVATLRLHGKNLAEMPFIGTRPMYRQQGMCRRLLDAIEEMLSSLHVEKLIIPAIPDLLNTWMGSFSFKPVEPSHKEEIRNLSLLVFAETTLLQKPIKNTVTNDVRGVHIPYNRNVAMSSENMLREYMKPTFLQNNMLNRGINNERGGCFIASNSSPGHILHGYPETRVQQSNMSNTIMEDEQGGHIIPGSRDSLLRLNPEYSLCGNAETTPCRLASGDLPGQSPLIWYANMAPPNADMRALSEVTRPTKHIPIWF